METRVAKYEVKAIGWEFAALLTAYSVIFVSAVFFIFMIFRASELISANIPAVDAKLYTETHTYIVLIEVVLWSIMARAAIRFKAYSREIRHSRDGVALKYIANAMLLSLAYAILFDLASTFKTLFMTSPYLHTITTITNLVPLALFLLLTILLFIGSRKLKRLVPDDVAGKQRRRQIIMLSLALFTLLVIPYAEYFHNIAPMMLDDDGLHHFVMPANILTFTYILPFSIVWLLGVLSCINLADYSSQVRGKIYKPMFRNLYLGILTAYISTYCIQIWYVSNIPSNRFGIGLLSLFILIFMLIAGFALMYRGANQLYRLEQ